MNDSKAVDEFLSKLKHPLKPVVEAIRSATLSADPRITEGIKWNAPSFYCNGWFGPRARCGEEAMANGRNAVVRLGRATVQS
jgi:hypothetical protein